jgi:hypothetical protein
MPPAKRDERPEGTDSLTRDRRVRSRLISEQRPALIFRPARKWLLLIAVALMIVTVVGCMVGPDYKPPAMKLPEKWNGNDQRMKDAANQGTKTDLATWWQAFDDPLLDAVIAQALSSNLDEKIALARIREERAYLVKSGGAL